MGYDFEPKATMVENVKGIFDYFADEYRATTEGCQRIVDVWNENKGKPFDERFKNIPGYIDGQHMIVLDVDFLRSIDSNAINDFWDCVPFDCREQWLIDGKDRYGWEREYNLVRDYLRCAFYMPATCINYHGVKELEMRKTIAYNNYKAITRIYTEESEKEYIDRSEFILRMKHFCEPLLTEEIANIVNQICPDLKAVAGQKTSRLVRKWFSQTGIDKKWVSFEKEYAKYSDAINPLKVPEKMVISWNLMDFLLMSHGTSWTSCHFIDKFDVLRKYGSGNGNYHGCYSSGTLSYALDKTSLVMYAIDKDATQPYWNVPKKRRQMFHIAEDGTEFIQGRLYPDDQSDCGHTTEAISYKPYREIMQDIIAKAFELPNFWSNKKGTGACRDIVLESFGTHYRDYEHYSNCNASIHKSLNAPQMSLIIGHNPICPSCGEEHDDAEWCTCGGCRNGEIKCSVCGEYHDEEDMEFINGQWYCHDCCHYCDYHEEYEDNDTDNYYIEGYGYVCAEGLEDLGDKVYKCEYCGQYIWYNSNSLVTYEDEDGKVHYYCCERCRDRDLA